MQESKGYGGRNRGVRHSLGWHFVSLEVHNFPYVTEAQKPGCEHGFCSRTCMGGGGLAVCNYQACPWRGLGFDMQVTKRAA